MKQRAEKTLGPGGVDLATSKQSLALASFPNSTFHSLRSTFSVAAATAGTRLGESCDGGRAPEFDENTWTQSIL